MPKLTPDEKLVVSKFIRWMREIRPLQGTGLQNELRAEIIDEITTNFCRHCGVDQRVMNKGEFGYYSCQCWNDE